MNLLKLKSWSEHQQVLAVILMAGAIIFLPYYFVLYPQNKDRKALEKTIEKKKQQLERQGALRSMKSLENEKTKQLSQNKRLREEWNKATQRLAAFRQPDGLGDIYVGHIDYKVRLLDVRNRLKNKSKTLGISLPFDLGMKTNVTKTEDARRLMLQLRAIEKLTDLMLDLKIHKLKRIIPLDPIQHTLKGKKEPFMEEYPVHIEFYGGLKNLYELYQTMFEEEHVFTIRHLRIEAEFPTKPGLLSIKAEISALAFLNPPDALKMPSSLPRKGRSGPMGH